MFKASLAYLNESEHRNATVLIGGLLSLFGFLIVPTILVLGYLVRVLDRVGSGDTEAPQFEQWGELFVDGIKAGVIGFVYLLVPVVVVATLSVLGVFTVNPESPGVLGVILVAIGSFLTIVAALAVWYVIPGAYATFATERRFAAGFDLDEIGSLVATGTYASAWLVALAITIVAGIVASVLAVIPVLGWIAAVFVIFYGQVAAYYLYGRAFGETHGAEFADEMPVEGEQPAV